jgi:hypothetical protein
LESVLREILSLRRVQSRNKFLRSTPTLDLLRAALGNDTTYVRVTIAKLTRREQDRVIRHCRWLPRLVAAATTGACAAVDAAVDTADATTGAAMTTGAGAAAMTGAAASGAAATTASGSAATTSAGPVTTTTVVVLVLAAALVFVQWLLM